MKNIINAYLIYKEYNYDIYLYKVNSFYYTVVDIDDYECFLFENYKLELVIDSKKYKFQREIIRNYNLIKKYSEIFNLSENNKIVVKIKTLNEGEEC